MKWILILMLVMPVVMFGQSETDNVLIITKEGTDKITLMGEILDVLDAKGIGIETTDKDFGRIRTEEIVTTLFLGSWPNRYSFKVKDGVCEMRGEYILPHTTNGWRFAKYKGKPKSIAMMTWDVMKSIAKEIGGELSYATN